MSVDSLDTLVEHIRVSSVLSKNSRLYGKQFLMDGNIETCWVSENGSPQWIHVSFIHPVTLSRISIAFQGGFAAKTMTIHPESQVNPGLMFDPENNGHTQTFEMKGIAVKDIWIVFEASFDFYGRIIVYKLTFH